MHNTARIPLSCGHSQDYSPPPKKADTVYCRRCADYSIVVGMVEVWQNKCQICKYGKFFAGKKREAYIAAQRHVYRWSGHVVLVSNDLGVRDLISGGNELITIPLTGG